jgi:hypothetical protein
MKSIEDAPREWCYPNGTVVDTPVYSVIKERWPITDNNTRLRSVALLIVHKEGRVLFWEHTLVDTSWMLRVTAVRRRKLVGSKTGTTDGWSTRAMQKGWKRGVNRSNTFWIVVMVSNGKHVCRQLVDRVLESHSSDSLTSQPGAPSDALRRRSVRCHAYGWVKFEILQAFKCLHSDLNSVSSTLAL